MSDYSIVSNAHGVDHVIDSVAIKDLERCSHVALKAEEDSRKLTMCR